MGKIAFVFAGQGAQYSGMGRELYDADSAARNIFDRLDALRPGTSIQCFSGSSEELALTGNTQPCMYAVELAAAAALDRAGIKAEYTAGFSLGEISALAYSGAVSIEDGFRLVCRRGELMQAAAGSHDSGMAAVLKLGTDKVEELCAAYSHVWPVNYNCPGQISVAGLRKELEPFIRDVKAAGGRAVPLKVQGGFHSPLMEDAADAFRAELDKYDLCKPQITFYSDYTALPYDGDYAALLSKQISNPVRWQSIVERMINDGVYTFIELGPGSVLCGLIKKISSDISALHVENAESLADAVERIKQC